jgi:hypothetical protein
MNYRRKKIKLNLANIKFNINSKKNKKNEFYFKKTVLLKKNTLI